MKFTKELIIKFALFHSKRMRGVEQTDGEYYVKQSMDIFIESEKLRLKKQADENKK